MHVISYRTLREFYEVHPTAEAPLKAWHKVAQKAAWKNLAEVKQTYPTADYVEGRTVFNIGGNKYRLIIDINFKSQTIYIKGVYTHKEYDKGKWKA